MRGHNKLCFIPFLTSELAHPYYLDESIIVGGGGMDVFILFFLGGGGDRNSC